MSVSQYNSNKGKLSSFSLISAGVFTAHTVLYIHHMNSCLWRKMLAVLVKWLQVLYVVCLKPYSDSSLCVSR